MSLSGICFCLCPEGANPVPECVNFLGKSIESSLSLSGASVSFRELLADPNAGACEGDDVCRSNRNNTSMATAKAIARLTVDIRQARRDLCEGSQCWVGNRCEVFDFLAS